MGLLFESVYEKTRNGLPSAAGKVFVITGTTSGTGLVAARTVAQLGGEVVLLNRPSSRAEASLEQLKQDVPGGVFVLIPCDMQVFASVRAACKTILARYEAIYCLVNNAGIMMMPDQATKDGFDIQMQTNHLSHFLLTSQLFPLLTAGAKAHGDARIVNHSSMARDWCGPLDEQYLGQNGGHLGGNEPAGFQGPAAHRYGQSKLANAIFTHALHDKIEKSSETNVKHIRALTAHPGIARTSLFGHIFEDAGIISKAIGAIYGIIAFQTAEDGASGLLKCMLDSGAESGVLYGPMSYFGGDANTGEPTAIPSKQKERDLKAKEMLWRMSEAATQVKFHI